MLEKTTRYVGFTKNSKTIVHFWSIVHKMSIENKKKLLIFVSGSDRVPAGGLANLKLKIILNGNDQNRIPTSRTCFNTIMLADYSSKKMLKKKLRYALQYSTGFGLA